MKPTRDLIVLTVAVLLATPWVLNAQTPVGTAFTYQGQLKQAGLPVTGQADMIFHLWDAETGGDLYDSLGISFIPVVDGLFTVELDFGLDAFEGDARWLEIELEFPSGEGNWTTLSPRQPLTAAPYALTAVNTIGVDGHSLDAADGSPTNMVYVNNEGQIRLGSPGSSSLKTVHVRGGLEVFDDDGMGTSEGIRFTSNSYEFAELAGETPIWDYYQSTDTHRFYTGDQTLRMTIKSEGNIGIGTADPNYPLHVEGSSARTVYVKNQSAGGSALEARVIGTGAAVRAYATSTESGGYGVDAYAAAPNARAVYAFNEAESGDAYAVYGENISPHGIAIYGLADNGDEYSTGIGVYGRSDSDHPGIGVYGETTNTGITYGVRGVSAHGTGVRGDQGTSGNHGSLGTWTAGVYGRTTQEDHYAVWGYANEDGFAGYFTGGRSYFEGDVGIGTTEPGAELEVVGDIKVTGEDQGVVFSDGTKQTTAAGGVPSGFCIMGESPTAPPGYTYTGDRAAGVESWSTKADMPTARSHLAAAAANGKIYVIGGYALEESATNEEYDPATNTWTTKAEMPTARCHLAAAAVNGRIYVFGGHDGSSDLATNEEYDPVTNMWTTKADLPTARRALAAAVVNGKIYAIGGYLEDGLGTGYLATVEEYDPLVDAWSTKLDMPTARRHLAAAAVNGKIYAIGGFNLDTYDLATVEEYDPLGDAWTTKPDMPTGRYKLAAASVDGKIYAIGGANDLATVEKYDPLVTAYAWTTKLAMWTGRQALAAAAVNGKIYTIGGVCAGGPGDGCNANEQYKPDIPYYIHRKD
jgi:N-acetylneuraminic acid mutarotase